MGGTWLARSAAAAPAGAFNALELKTAIVGRIAEFVRWPADADLDDLRRPFELVLYGQTPLENTFNRFYGDEQRVPILGHRVFFRRARSPADIGEPHLLFLAGNTEEQLPQVLATIGRAATLTVADTDGFAQRGVAVNLYVANHKVRFEVSRRALERQRLQASYRLLALARLIDDQQARR